MKAHTVTHETPDTRWRPLMLAVYTQALIDAKEAKQPEKKLDAVLWLVSDDAQAFIDAVSPIDLDVKKLVTSGRLRRMKVKYKIE